MIRIYDSGTNTAIYEDTNSGLLQEVVNNSVVAEARPDRHANYKRIADKKGPLMREIEGELY